MTASKHSLLLFDLDGTLLDTPRAIMKQMSLAVESVTGQRPDPERTRQLIGTPLEHMAGVLSDSPSDSLTAQSISAEYQSRYREIIVPEAEELVFPEVREGLERLVGVGLILTIITSKKHDSADLILKAAGLREHFTVVVGADDVAHPKPHCDSANAALAAVGRTDVGPCGAVIGDTMSDIALGKAIGALTIGVTYGVLTASQIASAAPDVIAHTFDEVTRSVLIRTESEHRL